MVNRPDRFTRHLLARISKDLTAEPDDPRLRNERLARAWRTKRALLRGRWWGAT
jgi:hypothetical protein